MAKTPISAAPDVGPKLEAKQKALGIHFVEDWLEIDANTPYVKYREQGLTLRDAGLQRESGCRCTLYCFRMYKYYAHHVRAFGVDTEPAVPFLWTAFSDKNVLQRSPNKVTGMTKKQRLLVADDAYRAEIAAIDASVPGAAKPAPAASATRSVGSTAGKSVTTKSQRSAALNSKAYKSSTSSRSASEPSANSASPSGQHAVAKNKTASSEVLKSSKRRTPKGSKCDRNSRGGSARRVREQAVKPF